MYAPGATEADAERYRALLEERAAAERVDDGPDPGADEHVEESEPEPAQASPRRSRRPVVVLAVIAVAGLLAGVAGTLATARPAARPTPSPTIGRHVVAATVPLSGDAPSLAEALAFDAPEASTIAESLDRLLVVDGRGPTVRQASALAAGPWVLALDDTDPGRTATYVTVVVHCGATNRYDWQLDGTYPGSTRTHVVATGSGRCAGDASAATVGLAHGEAPARLATTVRESRAYVLDVVVGR
jgi:hypothetical protein